MVDEVDVAIVDEFQPQWLTFLNHEVDALAGVTGQVPSQFSNERDAGRQARAATWPGRACRCIRSLAPDATFTYFNMEDPTIGGMTPEQIALRRAISLAYNVEEEIRKIRRGQAIDRAGSLVPHTIGYDAVVQERDGRLRPGACQAPCSTCTASSTATATAGENGPTARALMLDRWHRTRPDLPRLQRAVARSVMKAIGVRIRSRRSSGPRT